MSSKPTVKLKATDGLTNLVSNLGTSKDKRTSTSYTWRFHTQDELESIYQSDWLARKIIDVPVDDMTREWRVLKAPSLDQEILDQLEQSEKRLGVRHKVNECKKWARLYGGSLIVMGIDNTGDMSEPLDVERVTQGALKFMHVVDRWDVSVRDINHNDPSGSNYRKPDYYVFPNGQRIHYSRVLRFDGSLIPYRLRKRNNYWDASTLDALMEAVKNSQTIADVTASLVHEAQIDVIQVDSLMKQLSMPGGEESIKSRFELADYMKSVNNMLILDTSEKYQKIASPISSTGLPDLVTIFLNLVAGAADIPATRLLGQSAPGLNSTGEQDLQNYYDMVSSRQEVELSPQMTYFDEVFVRSTLGSMPDDLHFDWNPLWQMSEIERAAMQLQNAQRDQIYQLNGVVDEVVVAEQLQADGVYSAINDDYISALSALAEFDDSEPTIKPPSRQPDETQPTPESDDIAQNTAR